MKQERTIKELLGLLLEHQELFRDGLCLWVRDLYWYGHITSKERDALDKYIEENKPKNLSWLVHGDYYWKIDTIKPRVKWIKKHISRL